MSEARNDGGPAFPSVLYSHERAENWSTDGMSLRDWFAGQAINGITSAPFDENAVKEMARAAYFVADALLALRANGGTQP